jgi:CPA2 family monovalent cation:H+ antiporter-2
VETQGHGVEVAIQDFLVLIGLSIGIVALCQRIRLPALVGFILTGIVIGPHGLNLIRNGTEIEILAEIGIILLLFSLGIEFSLEKLKELRDYVLKAGGMQVLVTLTLCTMGAYLLGYTPVKSVFIGMVISLSSTAVGLKMLQQRREVESTHGRFTVGVLLWQDVLVPVFVMSVPVLMALDELRLVQIGLRLLYILLAMGAVLMIAKVAVPTILRWIVSAQTSELPILGSLFLVLLMSYVTQQLGLSPALGAFIAGIIISETPYSHQITANITPFRDSFLSLFFISVGLLINVPYVVAHWSEAIGWTALIIALKFFVVLGVALALRRPLRVGLIGGALLANVGEFSFVLLGLALQRGLIKEPLYQGLLISSAISIMLTPVLVAVMYALATRLASKRALISKVSHSVVEGLHDQVVVVGYGLNGRSLAHILKERSIPFVVVELNGALVQEAVHAKHPVIYGDAAHPEVLHAAHIEYARAVVFAMSDPVSTRYALQTARRLNPEVYILARTRYTSEIDVLYESGASDVIPEEFEAFIEIADRLLSRLGVSQAEREHVQTSCREQHYGLLKKGEMEEIGS